MLTSVDNNTHIHNTYIKVVYDDRCIKNTHITHILSVHSSLDERINSQKFCCRIDYDWFFMTIKTAGRRISMSSVVMHFKARHVNGFLFPGLWSRGTKTLLDMRVYLLLFNFILGSKFNSLLFQTHHHTLPHGKPKENKLDG